MGDRSGIEWTDATWNPLVGCTKVGQGCDHCYAIGVAHRGMSPQHVGLTIRNASGVVDWTGEVREVPGRLDQPLRWRRPRRVFVNSLSDVFHPDVSDDYIARIFAVMAQAPQHQFQLLTKRPQRMASALADHRWQGQLLHHLDLARFPTSRFTWPLPNVWLGTSIELDRWAFRADHLRAAPAAVRFISAEPLLGALDSLELAGIDWLIVGGESGPGSRPMHSAWVRDLRDRCEAPPLADQVHAAFSAQVFDPLPAALRARPAFHFKQWGDWVPAPRASATHLLNAYNGALVPIGDATTVVDLGHGQTRSDDLIDRGHPGWERVARVGKRVAGRELDGRTWDEWPAGHETLEPIR